MPRLLIIALFMSTLACAVASDDILPGGEPFNDAIPTPASELGWPVGRWHARPEQINQYFQQLAAASDRASLKVIGKTHEQRPLLHMYISSPDNQHQLEQLRQQHIAGDGPLVIWLGYSIHGNEASGSNAAMLVAYYLLASEADWVKALLENTVIILDPMLNPDGLGRFATWANMHQGQQPVADKLHREHNEVWPGGRFNHYWFDLNRDWLPLTQPESVARVQQFQHWQPNIFGDYHEQGSDAGYFFQPGVPERKNPLTAAENVRLTEALGRYHAAALDAIGSRYFTRERFDDFYYGKGSTYPDIQGSIGILFEQASARGHLTDSANGTFSFRDAIRNHFATSLSTLRGGHALRSELLDWQQQFFKAAAKRAAQLDHRAWIFSDRGTAKRAPELVKLLQQHQIEVGRLQQPVRANGMDFAADSSFVVAVQQRQSALIEAIFEQRSEFEDNTFYDVSAWTLPLAYNLKFSQLAKVPANSAMNAAETVPSRQLAAASDTLAWRFAGDSLDASALALALANADVPVYRVINPQRKLQVDSNVARGDFIVMLRHNVDRAGVIASINEHLQRWPVTLQALDSGLNYAGVDLGSPGIQPLQPVRPLLLTGAGINAMEAGHIWHLIDRRLGMPLPMLDISQELPDLRDYTHLLLADADYTAIPDDWYDALLAWVGAGGILITQKHSAEWAGALFAKPAPDASSAGDQPAPIDETTAARVQRLLKELVDVNDQSRTQLGIQHYSDHQQAAAKRVLGGAIFYADADTTHPLLTGIYNDSMPVLLNDLIRLQASDNAWSTPLRLSEKPQLAAGYASDWMLEQLHNQPLLIAERVGLGSSVRFAFNANFRAFWRGTEQLYINALVNSSMLEGTTLPHN